MDKIAFKSHKTRGQEIIKILENMGGVNKYNLDGSQGTVLAIETNYGNYITNDWDILGLMRLGYKIYTLEEYEKFRELEKSPSSPTTGLVEEENKPKFKVGDKVILDTYPCVVTDVTWRDSLHGFVYTVRGVDFGKMVGEENLISDTSEEEVDMVPKYEEYGDNEPLNISTMTTDFIKEHGFPCPDGYQFVDENGNVINTQKIVLEKKKGYPKTYEECAEMLGECAIMTHGYKRDLLNTLQKLIVCRDAYWKLYGEEMGLGKPWEPDWTSYESKHIIYYEGDCICFDDTMHANTLLAFPTKEMRDAFYENFKKEIETCKELL